MKVYFINKLGDFFLVLSLSLLLSLTGSLDLIFLEAYSLVFYQHTFVAGSITLDATTVLGPLFVLSGGVKSVQYGFHI